MIFNQNLGALIELRQSLLYLLVYIMFLYNFISMFDFLNQHSSKFIICFYYCLYLRNCVVLLGILLVFLLVALLPCQNYAVHLLMVQFVFGMCKGVTGKGSILQFCPRQSFFKQILFHLTRFKPLSISGYELGTVVF